MAVADSSEISLWRTLAFVRHLAVVHKNELIKKRNFDRRNISVTVNVRVVCVSGQLVGGLRVCTDRICVFNVSEQ